MSELSKPVAGVKADRNIAENWSCTDPEAVISTEGRHSDYNPTYSQEYVSALLAELEATESRLHEVATTCATAEQRVAELSRLLAHNIERAESAEKRLATPVRLLGEMLVHDWEHRVERQVAFEHRKIAWDARLAEDKKAILAAGFTFTVEGDE